MSVSYLGKRTYTTLVRPVNNQALTSVLVNVQQGGTGQANGFSPYALVTANSAAANSDTQALQSLALGSSGQVLVSSGSFAVPTWQSLSGAGAITSVASVANQTTVSILAGVATVGTVQDIGPVSTPSFNGLTLSNKLAPSSGGTGVSPATMGEILVASGAGSYTLVSPNTTATRKFLKQVSSVSTWDTLLASDVPTSNLSTTNDTNVTITASVAGCLLAASTITMGWTGTLAVGRGGTGLSTLTTPYGVVCAGTTATGSLQNAGAGTAGQWLRSGGSTALPAWTSAGAISKTDDTNVTLTLGESFATALLNAASLTLGWTGTLAVGRGGTGLSTFTTAYGVVCAGTTATGALQNAGTGTSGQWLQSGGALALPTWTSPATLTPSNDTNITLSLSTGACLLAASTLTVAWSGTLAVGRGGTGLSTLTTAYGVVCAGTTATGALQNAGAGTTGQWLKSGGAAALPTWTAPAAFTRTDDTNVTLTLSGNPGTAVLNTMNIAAGWAGNLSASRGGTGMGFYNVGDMLYADTTTSLAATGGNISTTRKFLRGTGTGLAATAPVWDTLLAADVPASNLTVTNDTNITGSVSVAGCLLTASAITLGWTGTLAVGRGGTGLSSTTAYAVLCGGTTSTGPFQAVSGLGTSGQVLTSQGASALPVWQSLAGGGVTSLTGTANQITASAATGAVTLSFPSTRFQVTSAHNVVVGDNSNWLATTATDGFLHLPICYGAPTGLPTVRTTQAAVVMDVTNSNLSIYNPLSTTWLTWAPVYETERIALKNATSTATIYTVPAGCTLLSIACKLWGAGGGSNNTINRRGGGGGYASGTSYAVSTATQVYIVVGYGGRTNNAGAISGSYFRGGNTQNVTSLAGQGGGASAVCWWDGTTMTVVAIAGGGAGAGNGSSVDAGAGGTTQIASASAGGSGSAGAGGAAASTAGTLAPTAGQNVSSLSATGGGVAATALTNLGGFGGNGGHQASLVAGGGGGGGYGGGGGGQYINTQNSCGGPGASYGNGTVTAGSGATPGNSSDVDLFPGLGVGGNWTGSAVNGTDGCAIVTIKYKMVEGHFKVCVLTLRALTVTANTDTALLFDSFLDSEYSTGGYKFYDPMGFHQNSANLSRFTVPTGGGGVYSIVFQLRPASGVFTNMRISVKKNGAQIAQFVGGGETTSSASATCTCVVNLVATDYIEFWTTNTTTTTVAICILMERL